MVAQPPVLEGFEARALARLKATVEALPPGTATLYVGADPESAVKSLFPYFRITPTNPRAAPIRGFLASGQGFDFTVGRGTFSELSVREQAEASSNEQRFFQICHAVFKSHFSERLVYDSRGRIIYSRIVLALDGRKVTLGGNRIFWWVCLQKKQGLWLYEPYF